MTQQKKLPHGDYDIELETRREDEIGEVTQNFNKMIKELQSTENLQTEFINNVSHEIKTPISSIEAGDINIGTITKETNERESGDERE